MAEAFGVTANVAGVVSLGLTVCQGLLNSYSVWKDAPDDVERMRESIKALNDAFKVLNAFTMNEKFGSGIRDIVQQSLGSCEGGLNRLQSKLDKIKVTPEGDKWSEKAKAQFRRSMYPFKQGTVEKLMMIANELRNNLSVALQALQIDASAVSIEKMDASLGRFEGLGVQVASAVNYSKSNLQKMDGLQIQVAKGINCSKSNFNLISRGFGSLQDSLVQTKSGVDELVSSYNDGSLEKVYDWLSPLAGEFENKQLDTFNLKGRQDGLGYWLLETTEFKKWMIGTGGILWCCGEPGIGKTVLASFVIESLQKNRESPNIGVAYIYCNYKDTFKQTPVNLIASLLHQLVLQKEILQGELTALHKRHIRNKTRPTLAEYTKLLQAAADCFSKVYIVIDALDECPEADQARQSLLKEIGKLDCVSVLVTSRNIPIGGELQSATRLDVRANDLDIRKYLEERMSRSDRIKKFAKMDSTLYDAIEHTILEKAKGMFLLAFLHMESLMTKNDRRSLKDALNSLPEGLDATYDGAMERIKAQSSDDFELARKVLYWINYALRPLAIKEIQIALAVRPSDNTLDEDGISEEERLLSVCAGLVTIQPESQTIILVHHTVAGLKSVVR